jgi:hypothetical protein
VQAGDGEEEQAADEEYVPSVDEQQLAHVEASGGSAAPRPKRRFRKSHCVKPPHVPSTPDQRRLITPVGDR